MRTRAVALQVFILALVAPISGATAFAREVEISWQLEHPTVGLHEPILVKFRANNHSNNAIVIDLGNNSKENMQFTIKSEDGKLLNVARLNFSDGISFPGAVSLKPGDDYEQKVVMSEWYVFSVPGTYRIEAQFLDETLPISDTANELILEITPRDSSHLTEICERLAKQAIETSIYVDADLAATALSYVDDPVAVPFMERVLRESFHGKWRAIEGLARIADPAAADALVAALRNSDELTRARVVGALFAIASATRDPKLKERIEVAIRPFVGADVLRQ